MGKICSKCGQKNLAENIYCVNCGSKLLGDHERNNFQTQVIKAKFKWYLPVLSFLSLPITSILKLIISLILNSPDWQTTSVISKLLSIIGILGGILFIPVLIYSIVDYNKQKNKIKN